MVMQKKYSEDQPRDAESGALPQSREQMLAARQAKERAAMQANKASQSPSITASQVTGGVQLVIVRPTDNMKEVMNQLGFKPETDLSNTYACTFKSPETLTVAQNALHSLFFSKPKT
jgi:hypothetical protein